jgi:diguanylate cyclase (GGDEF)-like protein
VLRELAERLARAVRTEDVVARVGGDEFVVVGELLGDEEEALAVAAQIQAALRPPVGSNGRTFSVSASVGIVVAEPTVAADVEALVATADKAMYQAKQAGGNAVQLADWSGNAPA